MKVSRRLLSRAHIDENRHRAYLKGWDFNTGEPIGEGETMTTLKVEFRKQLTVLRGDEYRALQTSAETDMRGQADQARYFIVEGLKSRGLLDDTDTALGKLVDRILSLAVSLEVTPKRIEEMVFEEMTRRVEEELNATSKLAG